MNEREIFLAVVEMEDASDRVRYLDQVCENQPELRGRLESLLKHHEDAGSFLERPPAEFDQTRLYDDQETDEERLSFSPTDNLTRGAFSETSLVNYLAPSSSPGVMGLLGQYEVLEIIGQGGMGVVLKAKDTKLHRIVAIKLLAPELASHPMARNRFSREARAAAAITHDHVVRIYAVGDTLEMPMLVMECIDGQSLQQKIDRTGALETKEILRIGLQAALGLAAAHKQGLVHRDIKPANILLENGIERVKITDFGLARAVDDIGMTQTGQITGTPQYMSPEQAQGDLVDHRSDLFSLGSVLYAMCTGRAAFRAESTVAVLRRVCDDVPRPIREINPEIPPAIADIVEQLMEKNLEDRIQSAEEVAELFSYHLAQLQQPGYGHFAGVARPLPSPDLLAKQPAPSRPAWGKVLLMAGLLLVSMLGISEATGVTRFAATIVRVVTGEGTLVVEVDDPNVSVMIEEEDIVITGAGPNEIRLKPGQYHLTASKAGKPIQQELVTVTRRGKQVVRISLEGKSPSPARDPSAFDRGADFPILAPFDAARWDDTTPTVRVNGTWYELLEIDGIPVKRIVDFCKQIDDRQWQKRFEEDLVQVMSLLGHRPRPTVTLSVKTLDRGETKTLKNVSMSADNRWALWEARQQRGDGSAVSPKLRQELELAVRAGRGELSKAELKSLQEGGHGLPDMLELAVGRSILKLLADLPEETRQDLLKQGYLKWPYASLSESYRNSFAEVVETLLKQAQEMGFGGKQPPQETTRDMLQKADVGFAVLDYPGSQQAITFYILTLHSPLPIGMPIVPSDPRDWKNLELREDKYDQLRKLKQSPNSSLPAPPTKSTSKLSLLERSRLVIKRGFRPTWTTDGRQLLYSQHEVSPIEIYDLEEGTSRRFLSVSDLNPNQSEVRNLVDTSISPDGKVVAVVKRPWADGIEKYLNEEVWVIPFELGKARRIAEGGYPTFGKDSNLLYFHDRKRNVLCSIRLDDPDSKPKDVLPCPAWYPAISPDGQSVAYSVNNQLEIASLESGQILASWSHPGSANGMLLSWSPDSKQVGLCPYSGQGQLGFWCYNLDEEQAIQISEEPIGEVAWSPDGRQLAFTLQQGSPAIYLIHTDQLPKWNGKLKP